MSWKKTFFILCSFVAIMWPVAVFIIQYIELITNKDLTDFIKFLVPQLVTYYSIIVPIFCGAYMAGKVVDIHAKNKESKEPAKKIDGAEA